jgi:hypothetical protein
MDGINGIQGSGNIREMMQQAMQMGSARGTQDTGQMNNFMPFDRTNFSQDLSDGQGAAFNNPFGNNSQNNIGYNQGAGMVPGFGGFCPCQMGGQQQQMQQMMMKMMMMLMMMMEMMQQNGMGNQQNSNQGVASASATANGNGASASASAGGAMPANYGNYFPNTNNDQFGQGNTLGSMFNGSLGQNGMDLGQGNNSGGGNVYNPTQGFNNVMGNIRQGTEGDCSAVGTIKAAMDHFGTGVFQDVQRSGDGGYNITLKDGKQVSLSAQEYQTATQMSGIKGDDQQQLQYANLAYGVMAKNALAAGDGNSQNFQQACQTLNGGEWPTDTAKYLGIENNIQSVDPSNLQGQSDVVGWSDKHTVFIDNGQADHYGTPVAYNGTDTDGNALTGAFKVVG